jgi:hypothetical protein
MIALPDSRLLREMAYELLDGFGDSEAGEWTEDRPKAFHLRRRLTAKEQERVGEAIDIRRSEEERTRMRKLMIALPEPLRSVVEVQFEKYA